MDNRDVIIFDFGKVIIERNKNSKDYYKEENGELTKLNEEELQYVKNILEKENLDEYYSEKLNSIIEKNDLIERKDQLMNFFQFLENFIPPHCRENFYRNLETLETDLNLDIDFKQEAILDTNKHLTAGLYNIKDNKFTMPKEAIINTWQIALKSNDPETFFWNNINFTLLHELSHMASSNYSDGIPLCGYNIDPHNQNRGLTEGMTECIAALGVPGVHEITSGYYIETLFINQLTQIVGKDVLIESYFLNKGTKDIEEKLNGIIKDEELSYNLFRRIEDNFNIKDYDFKQSLLGNVQSTLISYYKRKLVDGIIMDDLTPEEINNSLSFYERMLVTEEKLDFIGKNSENFIGLRESVEEFNNLKTGINNMLNRVKEDSSLENVNNK